MCQTLRPPAAACSKLGSQRFGGLVVNAFREANKEKDTVRCGVVGAVGVDGNMPEFAGIALGCPPHAGACRHQTCWCSMTLLPLLKPLPPPPTPHPYPPLQIYSEAGLVDPDATLSREQFASLLGKIDSGLRALPATAQVASQQGAYLAGLLRVADGNLDGEVQWRRRQCLPVGGLAMFLAYPVPTHPAVAATAAAAVSQSCRPMRASNTSTRDPWPMWDAVRGVRGGVERSALCPRVFPTCSLLDCTPPPFCRPRRHRPAHHRPYDGPGRGRGVARL